MKPLAKSTGVLLEDHVRHLLAQVDVVLQPHEFMQRKYHERTGEDLSALVRQSARWHDEGKTDARWQSACQKDFAIFQSTGRDAGTYLRQAGVRHELVSLVEMAQRSPHAALPVRVAVAGHHSKLSRRHQERWRDRPEFRRFWEEFDAESAAIRQRDRDGFEKALNKRYYVAGPRALLQMVDHRASAFEQGEPLPDFTPFAYHFPHAEKRGVQRVVEQLWDQPFAMLRAPTGAGKTDAALLWAQHQVECGRADRLVIAMPTRFTANALAISTTKDLSATGLYHSSAWYQRRKDLQHITPAEKKLIDKEQELARKLETPVTVTTIDHLCICLTATREDHHAIFFSLAHACVVIDEADFYDDFTQQNIVVLLRALRELRVPVLLMSATVPESSRQIYSASGCTITQIYADTTDYERPRCIIKRSQAVVQPEDISDVLQRALNGEPAIIYANTVKRAQAYFRWFQERDYADVVLYHSRFTEPHKVAKENRLREMLGREAWERGTAHGTAILTQIGEISVNISAELMISDLCPLDRLAQRAGRLSRFGTSAIERSQSPGTLFVVMPQRISKQTGLPELYPAPYGHFVPGKGWETGPALLKSDELLQEGAYSARRFVELVNELYPVAGSLAPHVRDNKRELESLVIGNWLILPAEELNQDDDQTLKWKSRDIPQTSTVYADYDIQFENLTTAFDNRSQWREFAIRHGIQCYTWEFNTAWQNNWIDKVTFTIRDEEEYVYLVRTRIPPYYDAERGLHFDDEGEDW